MRRRAPGGETTSPRLRPHRASVNPELAGQCVHADPVCAGCSHSVHFRVRETCSRSFTWFRRRIDQRVVGPVLGVGIPTSALVPRGNKPLDPWSPVPAVLHCFHPFFLVLIALRDSAFCLLCGASDAWTLRDLETVPCMDDLRCTPGGEQYDPLQLRGPVAKHGIPSGASTTGRSAPCSPG